MILLIVEVEDLFEGCIENTKKEAKHRKVIIMAHYNPMLVRLQRKIEEHNKNVQQTIDKVATRQKFITIGAISINLFSSEKSPS